MVVEQKWNGVEKKRKFFAFSQIFPPLNFAFTHKELKIFVSEHKSRFSTIGPNLSLCLTVPFHANPAQPVRFDFTFHCGTDNGALWNVIQMCRSLPWQRKSLQTIWDVNSNHIMEDDQILTCVNFAQIARLASYRETDS